MSDCSDPISIIIAVAVVVVIQFWLGKTDAIIEKKRNGFTDLLQFDSDGRASPICPRSATGVLQGSVDVSVAKLQKRDLNIEPIWDGGTKRPASTSRTLLSINVPCPVALFRLSLLAPGQISEGEERELEQ